tara:strand:+ start:233723 stop:235408 length:1686 start_codon:yes stop_codon:yes gene_type:complete
MTDRTGTQKLSARRNVRVGAHGASALAAALALGLCAVAPANAAEWNFGEATLNVTSTASVGLGMRTSNPDGDLISVLNGGRDTTVAAENFDDGNLNFRRGDLFTASLRMVHQADLRWNNLGAFVSVGYFYDAINNDADSTRRTDLSSSTRSLAGRGLDLYDAYVYGDFEIANMPLNMRLGNQVINWGESLFRSGGIAQTNAVDVSKLVTPGTNIREGYLPSPMIYANIGILPSLSLEAYYQFKWRQSELVPVGTFFSSEDLVGDGAQGMFFAGDPGGVGAAAFAAGIPRLPSDEPRDSGQYGVGAHYYADSIAAEFSAYYLRYHSKTPYVSGTANWFFVAFPTGYYSYFPEDIDLYGTSVSFPLGPVAIGAEAVYQPDYPVMLADAVTAAIVQSTITSAASRVNGVTYADRTNFIANAAVTVGPSMAYIGQVPGWIGADSIDIITEAGLVSFRGDKPAGVTGDMSAWGFTTSVSATYTNVMLSGLTVTPSLSFSDNVNGVAIDRGSAGTPVEGKRSLTLGVATNYQSALTTSLSYTNSMGGGLITRDSDRDYVTLSASYSF